MKGRPAPWMSVEIREAMQDRNEVQELKIDNDNSSLRERCKTAKAVTEWIRWSAWGQTDAHAWVRTPPVPL